MRLFTHTIRWRPHAFYRSLGARLTPMSVFSPLRLASLLFTLRRPLLFLTFQGAMRSLGPSGATDSPHPAFFFSLRSPDPLFLCKFLSRLREIPSAPSANCYSLLSFPGRTPQAPFPDSPLPGALLRVARPLSRSVGPNSHPPPLQGTDVLAIRGSHFFFPLVFLFVFPLVRLRAVSLSFFPSLKPPPVR